MSSDIENDTNSLKPFVVGRSYDLMEKNDVSDVSDTPATPPRNRLINRRFTHDTIRSDEIKIENVDPNMLENDESDVEKPNFNTFVLPKSKKIPKPNSDIVRKLLVSAGGDVPTSKLQAPSIPSSSPLTTMSSHITAAAISSSSLNNSSCSLKEAEKEMENLLRSENVSLHKQLEQTNRTLDDMRQCVFEYEKTIQELKEIHDSQLMDKTQTINNLICERDQAVQDLNTIEKAFTDLQRRFEKSKDVIDNLYKNESVLKKHSDDLKDELSKSETKCNNLKIVTERRLKKATEEVEAAKRQNESEIARLQALTKKLELKISGLEKQLNQKVEENHELTKICDELISTYSNCDGQ